MSDRTLRYTPRPEAAPSDGKICRGKTRPGETRRVWIFWCVFFALGGWAWTPSAWACAVCFGRSDDPIVQGVEMSVLFMVVLTYVLIVGGAVAFFVLRHRARKKLCPADGSIVTP